MEKKGAVGMTIYVFILFTFLTSSFSFAETIYFKNGQKLEANIIERTVDYIKIDYYDVILTYHLDEIDHIEEVKLPLSISQEEPSMEKTKDNDSYEKANGYFEEGKVYLKKERYRKAITSFQKAIELNKDFVDAYSDMGTAYAYLGEYQDATFAYRKALELDLTYGAAYINLGMVYYDSGKYHDAISICKKAIKLYPNFAEAYTIIGQSYIALGQKGNAKNNLKKAIKYLRQRSDEAAATAVKEIEKLLGSLEETQSPLEQR